VPEGTPQEETPTKPKRIAPVADLALGLAVLTVLCMVASAEIARKGPATVAENIGAIVWLGGLLGLVLTLVVASRAKRFIRDNQASFRGLATARASQILVILSFFWTSIVMSLPGFLEAQVRARISLCREGMRNLAAAIEGYHSDHGSYPAVATGSKSVNGAQFKNSEWGRLPTFRLSSGENPLQTLTTPVAYIVAYPRDPFASDRGAAFVYHTARSADAAGWVLISAGPDRRYNIDPMAVYDPSVKQPSPLLMSLTYDPTNGTVSRGDIWRVK